MSDARFLPFNSLYVRPNPDHVGVLEILDITLYPDTLWGFHFYGPASPGNFYDDGPVYETLVEADHVWQGDMELGTEDDLRAFAAILHESLTGGGDEFYGSGWTRLHYRPLPSAGVELAAQGTA
ncbi:hypothetical protein [Nonomuraea endophytica]|uniref:Uncharacterized protein n=1 Tax=Nonomuraea endophytica TaxID=714136 RepID=A0A7W8A9Y7_9ACTN|nr:hypothetical protein [Nonomuraea endophytica]MBB5081350.1 hypothetical protein [Nonomuraea endophytica]